MARVTLRITGTQLLCGMNTLPFWRRWNPTMWRLSTSVAKVTAAPVAHARVAGQVDWIAEPLAFIQPGKFCPVVAGQKAILKSRCELVVVPDTTLMRLIWPTTITWRSNTLSPAPSPLWGLAPDIFPAGGSHD